jgi:hypothetical protein
MKDLRQTAVGHSNRPSSPFTAWGSLKTVIPLRGENGIVAEIRAAVMAPGGSAGFNRSNAARNRDTNTTSPFVSRCNVRMTGNPDP